MEWFVFLIVFVVGAGAAVLYYRKRLEAEQAWRARREKGIEQRLSLIEEGLTLPSLPSESNFRPKKGELVYAAVPVIRKQMKSVTKRVRYGGPTARIKIAKGLYWRMGDVAYQQVKEDVLDTKGAGLLFITNQRLVFDAFGDDPNWVRTWKTILGWDFAPDQLIIETTSGKPMLFDLTYANKQEDYVDGEPPCLAALLDKAHG